MVASELIENFSKNPTARITTIAVNQHDDGERITNDPCITSAELEDVEYYPGLNQIHIGRW